MEFRAPTSRWTALCVVLLFAVVLTVNFGGDRYAVARELVVANEGIRSKYREAQWYVVYAARSNFSWTGNSSAGSAYFRFYVFGSKDHGALTVRLVQRAGQQSVRWE